MKPLALTHMNIATTEMKRSKTRFGLLTAAVALELLQSYLLAQDDWMDGDPVRRSGEERF